MTYREFVLSRVNKSLTQEQLLANAALGLAAEAGEAADLVKKHLFQGHAFDRLALVKELGDVLWYHELLCHLAGVSREEVEQNNVAKLSERYKNGFTVEASVNRKA